MLSPQWVIQVTPGVRKLHVMDQINSTIIFSIVHNVIAYLSEKGGRGRNTRGGKKDTENFISENCMKFKFQCLLVKCYWNTNRHIYELSMTNNAKLSSCKTDLLWPRNTIIFSVWSLISD